jgi:hypothetical protein
MRIKKPVQKSARVEGHHRLQVDGTEAGRLVGEEEHEADLHFFCVFGFFLIYLLNVLIFWNISTYSYFFWFLVFLCIFLFFQFYSFFIYLNNFKLVFLIFQAFFYLKTILFLCHFSIFSIIFDLC